MRTIGDVIALAMERAGLNQTDLAKASGVSRSLINKYVNAGVTPSMEKFERLAKALGMTAAELLDLTTESEVSGLPEPSCSIRADGVVEGEHVNAGPTWSVRVAATAGSDVGPFQKGDVVAFEPRPVADGRLLVVRSPKRTIEVRRAQVVNDQVTLLHRLVGDGAELLTDAWDVLSAAVYFVRWL